VAIALLVGQVHFQNDAPHLALLSPISRLWLCWSTSS